MYDKFQREKDGKIKQIKMTYKQKIESQKDNRRKSQQKENRYKPLELRHGEEYNRRTGYEPNRNDIDSKKDNQKDRDSGKKGERV